MIGLAGFINFEITAVSANFISLMFVLSISMNVHIMNNYLQTKISIIENFSMMFWPCLYTFLTTIVAFVSLIISDIKPVIDFYKQSNLLREVNGEASINEINE